MGTLSQSLVRSFDRSLCASLIPLWGYWRLVGSLSQSLSIPLIAVREEIGDSMIPDRSLHEGLMLGKRGTRVFDDCKPLHTQNQVRMNTLPIG